MKRWLLIIGICALAVAPPARADPQPIGEDPRRGIKAHEFGAGPVASSTTFGRCKTVWAGRKRTSAAGALVWRYRQEIRFCWKSKRITYLSRTRWGKTYLACCWEYQGHIGNSTKWNAKWSYRAFTEGKFFWYGPPFPMSKTPEIWMTVYGDGSWTRRTAS
jgi:hypothetical protein